VSTESHTGFSITKLPPFHQFLKLVFSAFADFGLFSFQNGSLERNIRGHASGVKGFESIPQTGFPHLRFLHKFIKTQSHSQKLSKKSIFGAISKPQKPSYTGLSPARGILDSTPKRKLSL
jgi:hypothetical protein